MSFSAGDRVFTRAIRWAGRATVAHDLPHEAAVFLMRDGETVERFVDWLFLEKLGVLDLMAESAEHHNGSPVVP